MHSITSFGTVSTLAAPHCLVGIGKNCSGENVLASHLIIGVLPE